MSTQFLHIIDKEVDEELLEMERMEIMSRVESPSLRSATVLETRMTSISSQLTTMSQQQGHFSKKLSAMSQQQSAMSQQQNAMSHQQGSVEFLGPPLLVFYPFSLSSTPVLGPPSFGPPLLVFHF